jgi:hypothetical protein
VGIDTPWWTIPVLGRMSFSTSFGSIREASSDNRRPFFTVLRAVWAFGDDLRLGATRGLLFGGRATSVPVTLRTVGLMLLGVTDIEGKDSDFENQLASLDVSYRTRVAGSPVRFHAEYGTDDSGLAFLRVPGLSLGAEVAHTRDEQVGTLGTELVWIAPSAKGHPEWYRHGALAWGWTDQGLPLGHELAGEGWGLALRAYRGSSGSDQAARLLLARRGDENLLAPPGAGWGIEVRIEGTKGLGAGGGGPLRVGWRLEAARLGHHDFALASATAIYRF